jgi:hypothetical protein
MEEIMIVIESLMKIFYLLQEIVLYESECVLE